LLVCGKVNFTNLSRYSELSERTYRRQYRQEFCFMGLNAKLIEVAIAKDATCIGAMDCSFIPKSGKATYGMDWFYNGSESCTQKGLEISVIGVIDVESHQGYSLSVQQTPAHLARRRAKAPSQRQSITWAMIEQTQQRLNQLPTQTIAQAEVDNTAAELTRMDDDLKHLKDSSAYLPITLKYWAVDGFYSKKVC
jgi:hypothetical protein